MKLILFIFIITNLVSAQDQGQIIRINDTDIWDPWLTWSNGPEWDI